MTDISQALLKRHLDISRPEFSAYWEKVHAPKVVPWALKHGIVYYAQVHDMRLSAGASASMPDLNIGEWDGAAEIEFATDRSDHDKLAAAADPYCVNVILPDERRFLVSEGTEHFLGVAAGTVEGDRRVIIENGKALIDCEKEMAVWREWEGK